MRLILLRGKVPINFPPLRGGVRGRGVHASDIVNGFPLSQSRDKAAGRRPFERPVVGRAKITPPAPPSQRGERNRGARGCATNRRRMQ